MHSLTVVSLLTHTVRRLKSLQSKHQNQNGATYIPATSVMWMAGRVQARTFMYNPPARHLLHAVRPDVSFDSQGIRIIQSNTSFLLLQYTYLRGCMFQLRGAIIRPLP